MLKHEGMEIPKEFTDAATDAGYKIVDYRAPTWDDNAFITQGGRVVLIIGDLVLPKNPRYILAQALGVGSKGMTMEERLSLASDVRDEFKDKVCMNLVDEIVDFIMLWERSV